MHIAPEHGDVGIYGADVPFLLLKPSLGNIAKLGSPSEIVRVFERVMGVGDASYVRLLDANWLRVDMQVVDAMGVLWACCESDAEVAAQVLGCFDEDCEYQPGSMADDHKIHIARHLLHHGMVGDVESKQPASGKPMNEFKAKDFVSLAIAHLGMSQIDAWGLSMTALVSALNAKFPDVAKGKQEGGGNAPTIDEHDATMEWFDKIRGKQ